MVTSGCTVFINLSKAFVTVNLSLLLSKLNSLSVLDDSTARKWFESYLSNRCQVSACNNSQPDKAIVPIGVPQGSSLGSLLFTVYINDLTDRLEHYMQMILSYSFLPNLQVSQWVISNQLTLSISKSKFIIRG